jgi:hypothetical protein
MKISNSDVSELDLLRVNVGLGVLGGLGKVVFHFPGCETIRCESLSLESVRGPLRYDSSSSMERH